MTIVEVTTRMTPIELFDRVLRSSTTLESSAMLLAGLMSKEVEFNEIETFQLSGNRQLVDRVNGLTITVFPREHPPPHFHIVGLGINASFSIFDGVHLTGDISPKQQKIVEFWYLRSRALLVRSWNETRPSNCPVGPICDN
jgi:hypothetical protein